MEIKLHLQNDTKLAGDMILGSFPFIRVFKITHPEIEFPKQELLFFKPCK